MDKKAKARPAKKDAPIVDSVRYRGEMVPRYAKDTPKDAPIRHMKDKGKGLEVVPDKYAQGGSVRGYGAARGGNKACKGA